MSETVETVLIKTANGPVRINKTDFKNGVHELHDATQPVVAASVNPALVAAKTAQAAFTTPPPSPEPTPAAVPVQHVGLPKLGVVKVKSKFYAANTETAQVVTGIPGIDDDGYKTNAEAWAAVQAIQPPTT